MKKFLVLLFLCPIIALAQTDIKLVSWNVESGGAHKDSIAVHIKTRIGKPDILALSELKSEDAPTYLAAFEALHPGATAKIVISNIGAGDKLGIIFNSTKLKMVAATELEAIALLNPRLRPSLIIRFRDKQTGKEFIVSNNHLSRGKSGEEYKRYAQAYMLQQWALDQGDVPVFLVGDFNFDYELNDPEASRSEAFDILRLARNGEPNLFWVKPEKLIRTQCSWDNRAKECRYNSVLDFVFCNQTALYLNPTSTIISWNGDFPDGKTGADHRPVSLAFSLK